MRVLKGHDQFREPPVVGGEESDGSEIIAVGFDGDDLCAGL